MEYVVLFIDSIGLLIESIDLFTESANLWLRVIPTATVTDVTIAIATMLRHLSRHDSVYTAGLACGVNDISEIFSPAW